MSATRSNSPLPGYARLFTMQTKTPQDSKEDITWRFVAHRGANNDAPDNTLLHLPENTLPAMQEAYRVGAHYVECDIHMTRDQRIVVIHDDTLERTASFNPKNSGTLSRERFDAILKTPIPELSYDDEVSQVSVGAYNIKIPEAYHTTSISPLENFLSQLRGDVNKRLIIELKAGDVAIVAVLQKLIERCMTELDLKPQQLVFISFDYHLIAASKKVLSQHKHLFLTTATPGDPDEARPDPNHPGKTLGYYHLIRDKITLEKYIQMAKDAGLDGLDVEYDAKLIDADFIRTIHASKMLCAIWTYQKDDNLVTARRMLEAGADFINTNHPQFVFEQLQADRLVAEASSSQQLKKQ
jgi:glycerophosphoryl diester phosphodiesterase